MVLDGSTSPSPLLGHRGHEFGFSPPGLRFKKYQLYNFNNCWEWRIGSLSGKLLASDISRDGELVPCLTPPVVRRRPSFRFWYLIREGIVRLFSRPNTCSWYRRHMAGRGSRSKLRMSKFMLACLNF